jgi:hypothetical protein
MLNPAKVFLIIGAAFIFIGLLLLLVGKIPGLGKLPGDIFIQKGNFSFYFPLGTAILLSIILTLILYLCGRR